MEKWWCEMMSRVNHFKYFEMQQFVSLIVAIHHWSLGYRLRGRDDKYY